MNPYDFLMEKEFGKRYLEYRAAYNNEEDIVAFDFPLEIDFDLRDYCNISCVSCHSIGRERSNKLMEKDVFYRLVEECGKYNLPAVNLGGCSEPLLDKEYVKLAIAEFKKARVMDIFLHTNAQLLDSKTSYGLIGAGLTYLSVSIDAVSQETYSKMRGGNLKQLVNNVEQFLTLRGDEPLPVLRVSFLANSINIHEEDEFIKYWKDKADYVDIQSYYKSYESQPEKIEKPIIDTKVKKYSVKKRMAIVAPNYLCASCAGVEVTRSINHGYSLDRFKTIKNFWSRGLIV